MDVKTKDFLGWKEKHIKTIEANYKRSVFFSTVFNDYIQLIEKEYTNLSEMNATIIEFIIGKFGIKTIIQRSSDLKIITIREEKVLDICNSLNATELRYSSFQPFDYKQLWGSFQSNVTVLDFLMNCGYDWQMVVDSQKK
jgi:hypothetical protein